LKPDDAPGLLPPDRRPFRVLIIAGSNRHQYNCPGVDGKARTWRGAWLIGCRRTGRSISRISATCLAAPAFSAAMCVSTSMALCVWPCNCYDAGNAEEPDLM
jgi:hypothetical protein